MAGHNKFMQICYSPAYIEEFDGNNAGGVD